MLYVEVKPEDFDKFEESHYVEKLHEFTTSAGKRLIILHGNPRCKPYDVILPQFDNGGQLGFFQDYDPYFQICDEYWFQIVRFDSRTGAPEFEPMDDRQIRKSFGEKYLNALDTARSERFGI